MRNEASIELDIAKRAQHTVPVSAEARFESLFREHQRAVHRWILRIVRDTGVAEDLTVETFWRIHRSFAQFDQARAFEPWARRIATRVALDWLRAQPRAIVVDDEMLMQVPDWRVETPGIAEEMRRAILRAFVRLPVKLRVAATLVVLEECTHKEAADALAISVAAVKLRVFRALRLLRRDLRQQGMEP